MSADDPVTTSVINDTSLTPHRSNEPASVLSPSVSRDLRSGPPTRRLLQFQARVWRFLEQIGLWLHTFPRPVPPRPSFIRRFSTGAVLTDTADAVVELAFYVPDDYISQIQQGKRYPVVVNLHGGGFTLGAATDDARWAAFVVSKTGAICVSVDYRLAPKFPFPTAVEDSVEALLHLAENTDAYGIDPQRMALSGFSSGGNLAFTSLLRLQTHLQSVKNETQSKHPEGLTASVSTLPNVVSLVSWYPSLDYRLTRDERRATCSRPDKTLHPMLTTLFDDSYLALPDDKFSPFVSASAAADDDLRTALPQTIIIYLCEWDMLHQEGQDFVKRLQDLGKTVHSTVIKETAHAFDKSPYPFSVDPKVNLHYGEACKYLKRAFEPDDNV